MKIFNQSKPIDFKNENNPYSNFDLSGTLIENNDNLLNFSSKWNTRWEIGNLTKEYLNLNQSKISTIKSTSELGVTKKIDKWTASPNTKRIMQIQNK